jgi:hypothetical protein
MRLKLLRSFILHQVEFELATHTNSTWPGGIWLTRFWFIKYLEPSSLVVPRLVMERENKEKEKKLIGNVIPFHYTCQ